MARGKEGRRVWGVRVKKEENGKLVAGEKKKIRQKKKEDKD